MQKMLYYLSRLTAAGVLSVATISLPAQAQEGRFLNLSSNGFIANNSGIEFISCSILEDLIAVVVFAEARPENPRLDPEIQVFRLANNEIIAENDDYIDRSLASRQQIVDLVGREPAQDTDAVLLFTKRTLGTDPVCVSARDVTPGSLGGTVNVQIQQVPFSLVGPVLSKAPAEANSDSDEAYRAH